MNRSKWYSMAEVTKHQVSGESNARKTRNTADFLKIFNNSIDFLNIVITQEKKVKLEKYQGGSAREDT